ncbi:hypothetical protein EB796_001553 [Bugula neritina]|uniref:Uncharacterized protein n=1 Tax=Bugula neritina TaxID=10212 RepID=A0A7J7KPM6_BUGNE|nr:hypothetical protein EB796_001553 [Bugula neritina]
MVKKNWFGLSEALQKALNDEYFTESLACLMFSHLVDSVTKDKVISKRSSSTHAIGVQRLYFQLIALVKHLAI